MRHKLKVGILTPFPAPYRVPLFNAFTQVSDIDLTVLITEMKGVPNQKWEMETSSWRFPYKILPSIVFQYYAPTFGSNYYPINFTLPMELLRNHYHVLVSLGWTAFYSNVALLMGKAIGTKTILWETSIPHPPSRLKRRLGALIKSLIGSYNAYLTSSTLCKRYLVSYGAKPEKTFLMPQVIDFKFFEQSAQTLKPHRAELRAKENLTDRKVICYVGQLIERKGVLVLIDALFELLELIPDVTLLIAGIGPLEEKAKEFCRDLGLDDRGVRFLGFVPQSKLPELYAVSDVFVLPSYYDTFGAVILEAMASGLPIVTTEGVGAAYDLVEHGVNGFVVPVGSANKIATSLLKLLENESLRRQMRRASKVVLENWNIDLAVKGFKDAVYHVIQA